LRQKEESVASEVRFRAAIEARDAEAAAACLAEDVVFHSPVLFRPFEGREATLNVLRLVTDVFDDFSYTRELHGDGAVALFFKGSVGDKEIEGLDLLVHDADGLISEFTVFMRPLSALTTFRDEMGARLAASGAAE
jgi:hypothetical protein